LVPERPSFNKFLRFVFLCIALVMFYFFATLPLTWPQQAVCGLLILLVGLALGPHLGLLPDHPHPDDPVAFRDLPLTAIGA